MAEELQLAEPIGTVQVRRISRARRLTLRVRQTTGEISVSAPLRVGQREIAAFVVAQAGWIAARRSALPEFLYPSKGDRLEILGEPVTLCSGPRLNRQGGVLALPGKDAIYRAALAGYLKETARAALTLASDKYSKAVGRSYTALSLRDTRSRWGSCSSAGRLMYSWRLVLAPPDILEYVAAHEVAHLREMNHGASFWHLVAELRPSFDRERNWLRQNGTHLHAYKFKA